MDILFTKYSLYEFFTLCCMIFLHFDCFGSRKVTKQSVFLLNCKKYWQIICMNEKICLLLC